MVAFCYACCFIGRIKIVVYSVNFAFVCEGGEGGEEQYDEQERRSNDWVFKGTEYRRHVVGLGCGILHRRGFDMCRFLIAEVFE